MGLWRDTPTGWAYDPSGEEPAQEDWPGPAPEPLAVTAGEQDHSDITRFVGPPAEAPVNP